MEITSWSIDIQHDVVDNYYTNTWKACGNVNDTVNVGEHIQFKVPYSGGHLGGEVIVEDIIEDTVYVRGTGPILMMQ